MYHCKHTHTYTQMGSRMKTAIFDEQTNKALKKWHMDAKKKKKKHVGTVTLGKSSARIMDGSPIGNSSTVHSSSVPTLHRFKTTGHSTTYEDQDHDHDHEYESDDVELFPVSSQTTSFIVRVDRGDQQQQAEEEHRQHSEGETNSSSEGEFSFAKPDPVEIRTTT